MSYPFFNNRRPGLPAALDGRTIHPAWCRCTDCTLSRRREIRFDLGVIGLGIVCALLTAATIYLLGVK